MRKPSGVAVGSHGVPTLPLISLIPLQGRQKATGALWAPAAGRCGADPPGLLRPLCGEKLSPKQLSSAEAARALRGALRTVPNPRWRLLEARGVPAEGYSKET